MREKIVTCLIVFVILIMGPLGAYGQLFEANPSQLQASEDHKYDDQQFDEDDFLSDPRNVEFFLQQLQRGEGRIVGGQDVLIRDYPWQISLQLTPQYGGAHMCGGTIIDDVWILTAAHCLVVDQNGNDFYLTPNHVRIRAGFTSMSNPEQGSYYSVEEIFVYPDYSTNDYENDIALIRLNNEIDLSDSNKAKVGIVTQEDADNGLTDVGVMTKVSGWGALSFGGPAPDILQAIDVPIVHVSNTSYPPSWITPDMILAGAPGQDACQGDSGGPMVVSDGEGWYKVGGVVSWGNGCGLPNYPGVYARVSFFENWIRGIVEVPDPNAFQIAHYETFGDGSIPSGWINEVVEGPANFPGWEWTMEGGSFGGQLNSTTADDGYLILNSNAHGQNNVTENINLISPPIDLTDAPHDVIFSVEHRARTFGNAEVSIYISTDNFNTQTELYYWGDAPPNQYNGDNPVYSEFNITDIAQGESDVRFKFNWVGAKDYWWLLDDFKVGIAFPELEIEFVVTDGENPLSGVEVFTPYTGQEAVTDENGIAHLTLYEGEYLITAKKEGYFDYEETITITDDGQIVPIDMELITYPEIVIDTDAIEINVPQGSSEVAVVNFSNPGDGTLEYALYAYGAAKGIHTAPARNTQKEDVQTLFPGGETRNRPDDVVLIHHDSGESNSGIGTGGATTFMTAARFNEVELAEYYSIYELGAINYYILGTQFSEVQVKVWEGGSDSGPGTEIYSADVTEDVTPNEWSTHILSDFILLEPDQEYWIGYSIQTTGGHPASVDEGPMVPLKGAWMYFSNVWQELSDLGNFDFNWNIQGMLYSAEEVEWLTFEPQTGTVAPETNEDIDFVFDTSGLELGTYNAEVLVIHNAGEPITIPITLHVDPAEFDVTFNVTDQNGLPVDDATITLGAQTNAPGDYIFENILVGMHEYIVEKTGYHTAEGMVWLNFEDLVVDITLISDDVDLVTLNIHIEDEFGDAVEDANFHLQGFGWHQSDAEGNITLQSIPGSFDYTVVKTGFEQIDDNVTLTADATQSLDIILTYLRFDVTLDINITEAGTVSGDGEYYYGETANILAEANTGYHFLYWVEDGSILSEDESHTFVVTENRHIIANFDINTYIITATANGNGGIDPTGEVEVIHGEDITFLIAALPGNFIEDVLVNGTSVGPVEMYTFENVTEDGHTIHAEFDIFTYEVNISSEGNGTVDPSGLVIVNHGDNLILDLNPDEDHHVADIIINGQSVGGHSEYILTNITENTNVHVIFEFSVDISDIEALPQFIVYPNPANTYITISGDANMSAIDIYSTTGQLVKNLKVEGTETTLDISGIQRGLYMLQITSEKGKQTLMISIQ